MSGERPSADTGNRVDDVHVDVGGLQRPCHPFASATDRFGFRGDHRERRNARQRPLWIAIQCQRRAERSDGHLVDAQCSRERILLEAADLFEGAAVLFEFLAGFAEFALRGEALVVVEFLDRAVD